MKKFFMPALTALVLLAALAPHTLGAAPQAVTFNVNSTLDEADANPGDGKCKSTPSKKCTLRAAVMETNALGGTNTITLPAGAYFIGIPGPGEDNAATGDLDIKSNLTIIGAGKANTDLNAVALDRWFQVISGKTTIKNMTLRGGLVSQSGGGIFVNSGASVTVVKSVLTGNVASYNGGAIAGFGAITVKNSTIGPTNRDAFGGGGIFAKSKLTLLKSTVTQNGTGTGGAIGQGGGLLVQQQSVIRDSTIDNNYGKLGGGVYVDGGTVEIQNSTIAKNSTATDGGAIYVSSGTVKLSYTTVADNETWQGSNTGGIYNFGGTVNLYHSLLDFNRAGVVSDDCEGNITTSSYNLIFSTTGCTLNANAKNILGISSQVNALAGNGGPTQTMSLQMGSDAIDVIPANKCLDANANPLTRDQRGKPRPADGDADNKKKCDLGAYEAQP